MNKRTNRITKLMLCATGLAVAQMTRSAHAAGIVIDGTLDAGYGAPLALQTNNTGFGDSSDTSGASGSGSELDGAYGNISGGNLYLFLSGNLELNGNHINIFIADGRTTGQSVLSVAPQNGPGNQLGNMTGSQFSSGFLATYALDLNGQTNPNTIYANGYDLTGRNVSGSYLSSFTPGTGTANALTNGISVTLTNTNVAGVNGSAPSMASATAAAAVTTGLELAIPLSILGSPKGAIEVLADVNGGGNGYLSNQFLPGVPTYENDLGGGTVYTGAAGGQFNFSGTPGQFFTVPAATGSTSINGVYNFSGGGSYNTASHWLNGKVPTNPGDSATFGSSITAPATITLDGNHTLGQITFDNANAYTIAPGSPAGTLTINDTGDVAGVNPLITVVTGSHVISAPVALANGLTVTANSGTTLTVSGVLSGTGPVTKSGPGSWILSAANTFTATSASVVAGTLELDNTAAAAAAQLFLGDPTADGQPATLNIGTAGLTIANSIVTNQDDAGGSSFRTISGTYSTGNSTLTGSLYLDGGVVLTVPTGATLTYAGVIANGQNGNLTANHDLTVGATGATTGTVVLSNVNTFTGGMSGSSTIYGDTFVDSGTLVIPAGAAISSNFVTVNAGATLKAAGSLLNTPSLFVYGTAMLGTSTGTTIGSIPLGAINVGQGALLTFTSAANHSGRSLVTTYGLAIAGSTGAWTGQIDLGNNDLDVITNGDVNAISDQVRQGYNLVGGGKFNGQGIISTAAALDTRHLTTLGVIQNTDGNGNPIFTASHPFDGTVPGTADVLVKFTFFGDANLDGKVDGSDYSLIDSGYALEQSFGFNLSGWYNGDFNYDGIVDGSDYALIDNAFNNQKLDVAAAGLVATSTAVSAPAAVPEPATLSTVAIAGLAVLRRRRH